MYKRQTVVLSVVMVMTSSVKLTHLMTGAKLPLYVILHVTVMTSFSSIVPEADRFVEHCVLCAEN